MIACSDQSGEQHMVIKLYFKVFMLEQNVGFICI